MLLLYLTAVLASHKPARTTHPSAGEWNHSSRRLLASVFADAPQSCLRKEDDALKDMQHQANIHYYLVLLLIARKAARIIKTAKDTQQFVTPIEDFWSLLSTLEVRMMGNALACGIGST